MKLFFSFLIVLFCFHGFSAEPDIEAKKVQLEEINSQLNIKRNQLNSIRKKEHKVLTKLVRTRKDLYHTKNNLRYAEHRMRTNQAKEKELAGALQTEQVKISQEMDDFQQRLAEIHKSKGLGYLELFFSVDSLADFINQSYYFEKIIIKDIEVVNTLRNRKQKISNIKDNISQKVTEIKQLTKVIATEKEAIQSRLSQEQTVYQGIAEQRKQYESEVAELEHNSQEMETMLQRLLAEGKGVKLPGSGKYSWPLADSFYISSSYGYRRHPIFRSVRFHSGMDMAAKRGTPVRVADSGDVVFAGWWGGYGKAILVDHGAGHSTVYGHLSRINVAVGQTVQKGSVIGLVGSTGYSTGPHLHFEIRINGKTANPISFLPKR